MPLRTPQADEFGAIPVHHTPIDKTGAWDAGANLKRLGDSPSEASLRKMHAWVDSTADPTTKSAYKLPHHEVSSDGTVGAAVMAGVSAAMGRLNGGALGIPDADRKAVHAHLAAHYKDAGMTAPEMKTSAMEGEYFGTEGGNIPSGEAKDIIAFMPDSIDEKNRTVDAVWYGGATVPRIDPETGDDYMLRLDMAGCRFDRLNAGAAVFDNHMSGGDLRSMFAGRAGTEAQVGVVLKAWPDGNKGLATLKFDDDRRETTGAATDGPAEKLFGKIKNGIVRNLSFGTWIYSKEPIDSNAGGASNSFVATDWEPFEISPVTVPADFTTTFLTASNTPVATSTQRASSPEKGIAMAETTKQPTGASAPTEQELAAVLQRERERAAEVEKLCGLAIRQGLDEKFTTELKAANPTIEDARAKVIDALAAKGNQTADGKTAEINSNISPGKDAAEKQFECMSAALLLRANPKFGLGKAKRTDGSDAAEFAPGCGPEYQRDLEEKARTYRGLSLLEMAREACTLSGINWRGLSRDEVATVALRGSGQKFGAETVADFPAVLANVANKTLRQAYQAWPQTFKAFCRQVTAADFKPIHRVQLNDLTALNKLTDKGEYHRAQLNDADVNYKLATYGETVAITRATIINDDTQAFTRIPALLGVAAAQTESNTVWAVITSNAAAVYAGDKTSTALFHANHSNLETGAGSALQVSSLSTARKDMRLQKAPNGTPLNLVPRFLVAPAILETTALQLIAPQQFIATTVSGTIPEWVRNLSLIIEPRLDAASTTAWYLVADSAQIDTVEYCYLEGQEGVYFETRQGFEVDGMEMKARMDFAAAAIEYRGMQKNAGA